MHIHNHSFQPFQRALRPMKQLHSIESKKREFPGPTLFVAALLTLSATLVFASRPTQSAAPDVIFYRAVHHTRSGTSPRRGDRRFCRPNRCRRIQVSGGGTCSQSHPKNPNSGRRPARVCRCTHPSGIGRRATRDAQPKRLNEDSGSGESCRSGPLCSTRKMDFRWRLGSRLFHTCNFSHRPGARRGERGSSGPARSHRWAFDLG